jgi:hypothetical protein
VLHLDPDNSPISLGDACSSPNAKTAAAARAGQPLDTVYDGYGGCPLTVEVGKVVQAEFGYDGKLPPTFPLDPTVPRRINWILKKMYSRTPIGRHYSRAASGWPVRRRKLRACQALITNCKTLAPMRRPFDLIDQRNSFRMREPALPDAPMRAIVVMIYFS